MKKICILLIVLLVSSFVHLADAQNQLVKVNKPKKKSTNAFRTEQDGFLLDLQTFLEKDKTKTKVTKSFLEQFTAVWNQDYFSEQQRDAIYYIANKLVQKRALPYPHIKNYIDLLMFFAQCNFDDANLTQWSNTLIYLTVKKDITIKEINDYFVFSANLLKENTLQKSPSVQWIIAKDSSMLLAMPDTGVFQMTLPNFRFQFDEPEDFIADSIVNEALRDTIENRISGEEIINTPISEPDSTIVDAFASEATDSTLVMPITTSTSTPDEDFRELSPEEAARDSIDKAKIKSKIFKDRFLRSFKVIFNNVDLVCYAKRDSSIIYQTSGTYFAFAKSWEGNGGKITWQRAGFSPDSVNATFQKYDIDMKGSHFIADSVIFYNSYYLNQTLLGQLEEKVLAPIKQKDRISYPRFDSYTKRFALHRVLPDIDYDGGFSMWGAKFIGQGSKEEDAFLKIYRGDTLTLYARSKYFLFSKEKIIGQNTAVTFYIQGDSIYHPGLLFKYWSESTDSIKNEKIGLDTVIFNPRRVELIRNKEGRAQSLYIDTYHNMKLDFELLVWRMDSTNLIFRMLPGTATNKANFYSTSYFTQADFYALQGYDRFHPLIALKNFAKDSYVDDFKTFDATKFPPYMFNSQFTALQFARWLRIDTYQVRQLLMRLSVLGYVNYNIETQVFKILPSLQDNISYNAGRKDYDVIKIESKTHGNKMNASLDLNNLDLSIWGAPLVQLSDSQSVFIIPNGEKITMRRNRSMFFDGIVMAGLLDMFGKNFSFDYDKFKLDLDKIDSVRVNVIADGQFDKKGKPYVNDVKLVMEDATGDILIDSTNNKSGIKRLPNYPIYNSRKNCYIYFDRVDKAYYRGKKKDPKDTTTLASVSKSHLSDTLLRSRSWEQLNDVSAEKSVVFSDTVKGEWAQQRDNEFSLTVYPYQMMGISRLYIESWKLKCLFKSGGIMPPFEETMTIQKDLIKPRDSIYDAPKDVYSLGFTRKADKLTMLYGGRSSARLDLKLSILGFRGSGKMEYVTSVTESPKFELYPDSINAYAETFNVREDVGPPEFPTVKAKECSIHFIPYSDRLFTMSKKTPFIMYEALAMPNDTIKLGGTLVTRPNGLWGKGLMNFVNSRMTSELYHYNRQTFDSDTADFAIGIDPKVESPFSKDNVNAHVDFVDKTGDFIINDKNTYVNLDINKYICYTDNFKWLMDSSLINIGSRYLPPPAPLDSLNELTATELEDRDLKGAKYISVMPGQDSLNYMAESSTFDIFGNILRVHNVKLIRIADATAYPDTLKDVIVEPNARMQTLKQARLLANNDTRYHMIYDAIIDMYPRARDIDTVDNAARRRFSKYLASGKYHYFDETGKQQNITFYNITYIDSTQHSFGKGSIAQGEDFTLSPYFSYFGEVELNAGRKFLTFAGVTNIHHQCKASLGDNWYKFRNEINPDSVQIPIVYNPYARETPFFANVFITSEDPEIYSAFFSKRRKWSDSTILYALGYAVYDKDSFRYRISTREKLENFDLAGNYMSLNTETCEIYGEGKLSFGVDLGRIKTNMVGSIYNDVSNDLFEMDAMLGVDFYFSDKALSVMAEAFKKNKKLKPVDLNTTRYMKCLIELLDTGRAYKVLEQLALKGEMEDIPTELKSAIVFTDVRLRWNTPTHTFRSYGKIGIGSIGGKQINKYVDGLIEVKKSKRGDDISIYLPIGKATWFFFNYKSGVMQAIASSKDFNDEILKKKEKDRKIKSERKGMIRLKSYIYTLSSNKVVSRFKQQFSEGQVATDDDNTKTDDNKSDVLVEDEETETNDSISADNIDAQEDSTANTDANDIAEDISESPDSIVLSNDVEEEDQVNINPIKQEAEMSEDSIPIFKQNEEELRAQEEQERKAKKEREEKQKQDRKEREKKKREAKKREEEEKKMQELQDEKSDDLLQPDEEEQQDTISTNDQQSTPPDSIKTEEEVDPNK